MRIGIINPGTWGMNDATEENATQNMHQFVFDLEIEFSIFVRTPERDYGEGRYAYLIRYEGRELEIQMPGRDLERVRYIGRDGQNVWAFPRLYVDGDSWVWMFAINQAKRFLTDELDTTDVSK